eukprot:scaffold5029_cov224-Pinguiococcus_pyrenoidosus.AAC.1
MVHLFFPVPRLRPAPSCSFRGVPAPDRATSGAELWASREGSSRSSSRQGRRLERKRFCRRSEALRPVTGPIRLEASFACGLSSRRRAQ